MLPMVMRVLDGVSMAVVSDGIVVFVKMDKVSVTIVMDSAVGALRKFVMALDGLGVDGANHFLLLKYFRPPKGTELFLF